MEDTVLYCNGCDKEVDEEDVVDGMHIVCGGQVEEVCAYCLGTGEVTVDERVYPGEPHMAPIGTRKCICQIKDDEREDD